MPSQSLRIMRPRDVFETIRDSRQARRWVIPLFGSGVSVDTGFPVASHLVDYLVRFAWWRNSENDNAPSAYLRANLWPSRHDLNIRWWTKVQMEIDAAVAARGEREPTPESEGRCRRFNHQLRNAEINLRNRAMVHELQRRSPTAAGLLRSLFIKPTGKLDEESALKETMSQVMANSPGYTDYRALLNYLCDGDATLIDAFFDHFSRNRPPSATHQHLAFVTRLLGCRLLLTTNFDPFTEQALANEGMSSTVYEVTTGGSIPSARLLHRQNLSIVKLHGGAYSLRTGFDLDDAPPAAELAEYASYFRPPTTSPPLILVMGYSGSDRRVMSILETHLQNHWDADSDAGLRIIWISRSPDSEDSPVSVLAKSQGVARSNLVGFCCYRDAGLFLHELYQNLEYQHPVTHGSYHVLTQTPRDAGSTSDRSVASKQEVSLGSASRAPAPLIHPDGDDDIDDSHVAISSAEAAALAPELTPAQAATRDFLEKFAKPDAKFLEEMESRKAVVFVSDREGRGTSLHLAKAVGKMEKTHTTIWIDAAEVRSRAAMFTLIEEAFHRYDRHLIRISRPLMYQDVDYLSRILVPDEASTNTPTILKHIFAWEETIALRWISMAMRRGRYVLAIDSLGEFTQGHQSVQRLDSKTGLQFERGLAFLTKLLDSGDGEYDLGESKVFIAMTRPEAPDLDDPRAKRRAFERFKDRLLTNPSIEYCELTGAEGESNPEPHERELKASRRLSEMLASEPGSDDRQLKAMIVLLASFWRRPRSLAALVTVTVRAARRLTKYRADDLAPAMLGIFKRVLDNVKDETELEESLREHIVKHIWELSDVQGDPLLVRLEGGFFWLHRGVRAAAWALAKKHLGGCADEVFDCFADFVHADMHSRSKDAPSYLEYFFLRLASFTEIAWPTKDGTHDHAVYKRLVDRCTWLVSSLELERERLLAYGRLTGLLNHIRTFLIWLEEAPDEPRFDAIRSRVLSIYADIFLSCGHPQMATAYRYLQLLLMSDRKPAATRSRRLGRSLPWQESDGPALRQLMCVVDCDVAPVAAILGDVEARLSAIEKEISGAGVPEIRARLNDYRKLIDLLIDIAVSLDEPTLFNECLDDPTFWESNRDRRTALITRLLGRAIASCQKLMDGFGGRIGSRESTQPGDVERWARAKVRDFEHRIHVSGACRFSRERAIEADSREARELADIERECEEVNRVLRAGPNSSRRKRHKCYLSLIKARCQALRDAQHDAQVNFQRALASLPRAAGAAERTAEAVVYLFQAEAKQLKVRWIVQRQAERAQASANKDAPTRELANDQRALREKRDHIRTLLDESESLLDQARPAMNREGRSENRWRVFLSYLKANLNLLRSEQEQSAPRAELVFDALRHVVAALTNTGVRTDRRFVLVGLYNKIHRAVDALPKSALPWNAEVQDTWRRWKTQVGLPAEDDPIDRDVLDELRKLRS